MTLRHLTGIWLVRVALLLSWLAVMATASFANIGDSAEGRRLALVIGNSDYQALPALKNAAGDAGLVAGALEKVGFKVTLITNAGLDQMNAAIEAMAKGAQPTDHVVFYYSGHGFQLDGTNYVVPIDAVLTSKDEIDKRTIRLNAAIRQLQTSGRQTMVFVDACRDNPLPPSIRGNQTVNGLAKLGDGVAQNLFVAFATSPGRVSLDGTGDHGPFAAALAKYLGEPNVPIYLMMTSVRNAVLAATGNAQFPTVEESLLEPFYFNGAPQLGLSFGTVASDAGSSSGGGLSFGAPPAAATAQAAESPATAAPVPAVEVATTEPAAAGPAATRTGEVPAMTAASVDAAAAAPEPAAPAAPDTAIASVAPAAAAPTPAPADSGSGQGDIAALAPSTASAPAIMGIDVTDGSGGAATTDTAAAPAPEPEPVPLPAPDRPADADTTTQVATVETPPVATPQAEVPPPDYAELVQRELKRIGCYSGAIDGDWGSGSRSALQRYIDEEKVASLGTDPTEEVYNRLSHEKGDICKPEPKRPAVAAKPRAPRTVEADTQPVSRPRAAEPRAPEPPPPAATFKPSFGTGSFR